MRSRHTPAYIIAVIAACQADMPTQRERSAATPVLRSNSALFPTEDSLAGYEIADSVLLDVSASLSSGISGERELGSVTGSNGPIVVEIEGSLLLDSVSVPLGEVINANGMLFFEHTMSFVQQSSNWTEKASTVQSSGANAESGVAAELAVPVPPEGFDTYVIRRGVILDFSLATDTTDEVVVPEHVPGSANRVRLVLDSASRGLLTLRWSLNSGGRSYRPEDYTDGCLPIANRCVPFPPDSRVWTVMSPDDMPRASGSLKVRVYRLPGTVRRMVLTRDTVRPVFALRFFAQEQRVTSGSPIRYDTVRIEIPGLPVGSSANAFVTLDSRPERSSGGHTHEKRQIARPRGTFFRLSQLSQVSSADGGQRRRMRLRRPIGRDTAIVYRTSGVGGNEWIVLRPDGDTGTVGLDSVRVTITTPNLIRADATSNFYFADSDNHSLHDRYLQPGVLAVLDSILGDWLELHRESRTRYRMQDPERGFKVDAMALPNGGLHDIDGRWGDTVPSGLDNAGRYLGHQLHREGVDVDVNDLGAESDVRGSNQDKSPRELFVELCAEWRYQATPTQRVNVVCAVHGSPSNLHFHILFVPAADRATIYPWRR